MPLNRLFAYLFRNEAGDVQFLYLVDDRWTVKYTFTQKMEMEPFTEVNLNIEQGRSKYYLIHKGPECEISAKYQKEIDQRRQTEKYLQRLKSIDRDVVAVPSSGVNEKAMSSGRLDSRKDWSLKHASQTSFKSERTARKKLKRKHPIDSNLLQMIKETKSNESVDKAVSSCNKLIEI